MKSQNLGNPLKYSGEWIKNPFSLEQNITMNDKFVAIKTSLPKRFFAGQELTIWVAGVKMKCRYVSESEMEIMSHDINFNVIQKSATLYVLNNFSAEYSEELVPKSELDSIERKLTRAIESFSYNYAQQGLTFIGDFDKLADVHNPKAGDITKCNGTFWVYSKVMLSCVIEKVTDKELTITFIGDARQHLKDTCVINDVTYTLALKKKETERMITFTYTSDAVPSVSDPIYVYEWTKCIIPTFFMDKIMPYLS